MTDAATRGVDLPETACVVNYDAPTQGRTYAHRAGRTARAGRDGICMTLLQRNQVCLSSSFSFHVIICSILIVLHAKFGKLLILTITSFTVRYPFE